MDGDIPIAMTGRVYVKCTTENGPIRPGDRLAIMGETEPAWGVAELASLTVLHYDADFDHIATATGQSTQPNELVRKVSPNVGEAAATRSPSWSASAIASSCPRSAAAGAPTSATVSSPRPSGSPRAPPAGWRPRRRLRQATPPAPRPARPHGQTSC